MKKALYLFILLILGTGIFFTAKSTSALSAPSNLKGKILLQVESKGEAWYVSPADGKRYSMGRPNDAFNLMRQLGVGISNDNLKKIKIANENLTGQDSDNDGLSDMAEDSIGTDKNNSDSDGDGFNDKDEILGGYNPSGSGKLNLDSNFAKIQAGKILLQVEKHGEAWYVNPDNNQRYFMGRPVDAFNLMRKLGLGISNNDLSKITEKIIKDCGKSFDCLIDAAKTCTPAKVDITTTVDLSKMLGVSSSSTESHIMQTQRSIAEIKGISNGKCVYFTKLLDVQNPNMPPEVRDAFLGKEGEMTCSYDSADLAVRLKNVQEGNTSMSFDTKDTPEQKVAKQCQNYGASLEGSTSFSTKDTPESKYSMTYDITVIFSDQRPRAFGNKNEIAFEAGDINGDSAQFVVFDKSGALAKIVTLKLGESIDLLNNTIELKSINLNTTPKQIVLKISEYLQ